MDYSVEIVTGTPSLSLIMNKSRLSFHRDDNRRYERVEG
jgi:hypothetical protein